MNITIVQFDIVWEDASANLAYLDEQMQAVSAGTDLVILPEMFPTGVTTNVTAVAETMSDISVSQMIHWAQKYQFAVCGGVLIHEDGHYYNRFVFVTPEGKLSCYDKRHRFILGGEHEVITAGKENIIIEYKGWRIKPQICYDLRFPVWSRNTENYDLLIYVSNWPKSRLVAYETLLQARAIENQCYVCACNRVGTDGNRIIYNGNSLVVDPKGVILNASQDEPCLLNTSLSMPDLKIFRQRFPVLEGRDDFELNV